VLETLKVFILSIRVTGEGRGVKGVTTPLGLNQKMDPHSNLFHPNQRSKFKQGLQGSPNNCWWWWGRS